jgi:zinc/manganese transport system substrate-binding protein
MRKLFLTAFLIGAVQAPALTIVTSTADLGALARELAGPGAAVDTLCPAGRNPHDLEAKPSFMVKVSRADLVVATGLELEQGWLPNILRGARNPKVLPGTPGYFEAGSVIQPLEVLTGATRAGGDVHPAGNPHFMLDPLRAGDVAVALAARLGQLDPAQRAVYQGRGLAVQARLKEKAAQWQQRIKKSAPHPLYTYHKTLAYFLERFGLDSAGQLEPKPGIPPTAGHLVQLVQLAKERGVGLILVESFYDRAGADKVAGAVPGLKVRMVDAQPVKPDARVEDAIQGLVDAVVAP